MGLAQDIQTDQWNRIVRKGPRLIRAGHKETNGFSVRGLGTFGILQTKTELDPYQM